jgi:hypothetical protein
MSETVAASSWRRFLHRLAGRLPTRIIHAETSADDPRRTPMFERSHVFTVRLPFVGAVTCYLHHYLRSDPDEMHDHPWPWAVSLPLAGGYLERRLVKIAQGRIVSRLIRRLPFMPYRLDGFDFHSVVVEPGKTSWSLFFVGAHDVKAWGFLREGVVATAGVAPAAEINGVWYEGYSNPDGNHTPWHLTAPKGAELERAAP